MKKENIIEVLKEFQKLQVQVEKKEKDSFILTFSAFLKEEEIERINKEGVPKIVFFPRLFNEDLIKRLQNSFKGICFHRHMMLEKTIVFSWTDFKTFFPWGE